MIAVTRLFLKVMRLVKPLQLLAHFAAPQMTSFVIVLCRLDNTALAWIAFDSRERSVETKGPDDFGPTVIVVMAHLANSNTVAILLVQIDPAVEIAVALGRGHSTATQIFEQVGLPAAIGVERYLVLVGADAADPLVRRALTAAIIGGAEKIPFRRREA